MESHLWWIAAFFLAYLLFATAEAASQLLSKHKAQVLLDSLRERSRISTLLLPGNASALRSVLTVGRLLSVTAVALSIGTLGWQSPMLTVGIAVAALLGVLYLPVLLAYRNPKRTLSLLLPLIRFTDILLLPLALPRNFFFALFRTKAKRQSAETEDIDEAQKLEAYIDEAEEEGLFEPDEAKMVRQVVEFGDTLVKEVMTPRVDMDCVDVKTTLADFRSISAEAKFSRYPVIDGKIDNVIGIAHIKSLLDYSAEEDTRHTVAEIMTAPVFVPESKKVISLLRDFQLSKQLMALVVDEYGGIAGLITLEDILEEIVGEIEDEHDELEKPDIEHEQDGSLLVSGNADVTEVEKILGVELDDESYETVSGLALEHMKRIPTPGEHFVTKGVKIEILDADDRSINQLRLTKIEKDE